MAIVPDMNSAASLASDAGMRFVARQPILDREEQVFGYELLFRSGLTNLFSTLDQDAASKSTLDTTLLQGLDVLCDGRCAFINTTREVLVKNFITLLPPWQTIVEVLESVPADDEVYDACKRLKDAGYRIALDDFIANDPRDRLTCLADIIKVDCKLTSSQERREIVAHYAGRNCRMLAEKVETRQEFMEAKQQGFLYFQGYFFCHPEVVSTRDVPPNHLNYLQLLNEVSKPELDLDAAEAIIKREASLCYRLLRFLNSAAFGVRTEVRSIHHALVFLGERQTRRWVQLIATVEAAKSKSSELLFSALVRAHFCEVLSTSLGNATADLFLMGLLSLMDAILEVPMDTVLNGISLEKETQAVLLGKASKLRPMYQLMLAYESGEWGEVARLATQLGLSEEKVSQAYWEAMQWAHKVTAAGLSCALQ